MPSTIAPLTEAPSPAPRSRLRLPYFVLTLGLILTTLGTVLVHRNVERQDRAAFDAEINLARATMEKRVVSYLGLIRSTGQIFYIVPHAGPNTFYIYVRGLELMKRYPGIRGIGVSIRFPLDPAKRQKLLHTVKKVIPGFEISPPGERREYHSIIALFPEDNWNKKAIGYDMHTDITRADAMDRARDSGNPAATGKVLLVQDRESPQPGFLIYSPLYNQPDLPAPKDRYQRSTGYVYSPFRMREVFKDLFHQDIQKQIAFEVRDVTERVTPPGGDLLYRSWEQPGGPSAVRHPRFEGGYLLHVADRTWRFSFRAAPGYLAGTGTALTALIAVSGAAVSFLLFGILLYQNRAQRVLEARQQSIEVLNEHLRRAMRETHHRVKNNLQVIAAMIDMQAMDADPGMEPELRRLSMHVTGLAAVHDILTDQARLTGNTEHISAKQILEKLLPLLEPMTLGRPLVAHLDDALLSARQGTSLAIVTNELVSNAIKHGRGPIEVNFAAKDGTAALNVADEGPGFPATFSVKDMSGTGLQLVESLSAWDLGGGVRFRNRAGGGAQVTVDLALSAP